MTAIVEDRMRALDRHHARRRRGAPVLSVLAGSPAQAHRLWSDWAARERIACASAPTARRDVVAEHWVRALVEQRDFREQVAAQVEHRFDETLPRGGRRTARDLDVRLAGLPDVSRAVVRRLLERRPEEHEGLAAALERELGRHAQPHWRVVRALVDATAAQRVPALLVCPEPNELGRAAHELSALAELVPTLPLALAAEADALFELTHGSAESHAVAMVREGLVVLDGAGFAAGPIRARLRAAGIAPERLGATVRCLAALDAAPALVEALASACAATAGVSAQDADRARSSAERFLFGVLEHAPDTRGRFELNGRADFRFGERAAEIDLLARDAALAVEIDGFHHFQDSDAYRRDRRKDLALQQHGYLVLRFLAEDVVVELESILATLRGVLATSPAR